MRRRDDDRDAAADMLQHGVEHVIALGIGQHELLGEIGEDAQPLRAGIDHAVDGTLLAVEIEPAVAVEHRRHDGKDTLVGPLSGGSCHDHSPFSSQPAAPWRRRPLKITSFIAADAASASRSAIAVDNSLMGGDGAFALLLVSRRAQPERRAQRRLDHGADRPHERIGRDRRDIEMQPKIRVGEFDAVGCEAAHPGDAVAQNRRSHRPSRRSAASAAARGSTARRMSARSRRKRLSIPASRCQPSTSTSNMFQAERSLTRVPTPALALSSPLADSVLTLSRSTVRETLNIAVSSASRGSGVPSAIAADDDVDPDGARHFQLAGMAAARRNHDEIGGHGALGSTWRPAIRDGFCWKDSWLVSLPDCYGQPSCLFGHDQAGGAFMPYRGILV